MQITQAPPIPLPNTATQPQTLPNTLPHVLTQAVAPISQQALAPTAKTERGQGSRSKNEHDKDEMQGEADHQGETDQKKDGHVNISV